MLARLVLIKLNRSISSGYYVWPHLFLREVVMSAAMARGRMCVLRRGKPGIIGILHH